MCFNPVDEELFFRHQLDIVGQISGEFLLGMSVSEYTIESLPTSVSVNEFTTSIQGDCTSYADIGEFE